MDGWMDGGTLLLRQAIDAAHVCCVRGMLHDVSLLRRPNGGTESEV